MINKLISILIFTNFCITRIYAQSLTPTQYINLYKDVAIREMKRMGVPAAITLAQGLLETENGNSVLVKKSNNHFGIKCKSNWTAAAVTHDDDAPGECFRSYNDAEESFRDHSNFLRGSARYGSLFNLNATDYKGWAYGLKRAGYATNPKYPAILIRSIEQYNLQQYTIEGASETYRIETDTLKDNPLIFDANKKIAIENNTDGSEILFAKQVANKDVETGEVSNTYKLLWVNKVKCIYAEKGTSLLAIATRYNVALRKLLDYNDLEEDGILDAAQLIFLQRKADKGAEEFYLVQRQETYYDIAQKNGIQLSPLLDYNGVTDDTELQPGTRIYLQAVAQKTQANITNSESDSSTRQLYSVKPKEGLYAVAKKHNVTVQQLKEWNNLTSDNLKVGQQLVINK